MGLLNYTTKIEANKTAFEIQAILAYHGAKAVLIEYGNNKVEAISFKATTPQGELGFRLPIDVEATLTTLKKQWNLGKVAHRFVDYAQAERVAWRIVKDWVEAQMAILETGMVKLEQIFLPYALTSSGQTFYERLSQSGFQLPPGKREGE